MKQLLAFIFSMLLTGNVWAADNTVIVTPGTGVTIRSKDVGAGVESMIQILGDTSGNALATAPGTPNSVFALPIQGVTSGTPVPISGSLTNISGTISLPTGAATSALQTTGNTALTTINTTLGTPMQNSGGSVTANLGTLNGAATAANQTTANTSLATIATNTGAAITTQDASVSIGGVGIVPTSLSAGGITPVVCGSAASSCVLKASAGNLYSAYAECTAACWLMIFNSTTAPSNGSTTAGIASGNLVECIDVSAGSSRSLSFAGMPPEPYSVGITAAISSTACASLTLSTVGFVKGSIK